MPFVYLDLFILVNAAVDYVLLAVTAQATQVRSSRWRRLAATAWGTVYAAAVTLRWLPGLDHPLSLLAASVLMLAIAFWPVPARSLLGLVAWFYGLACFVAGGALAVLSLGGGGLPLALVLATAAVVAAGRFFWRAWRSRSLPGPVYVTLGLACDGRVVRLPALVDTGNQLRDPLTGLAVVVVEEGAVAPLLPEALRRAVAGDDIAAWARAAGACGWADRLRIVPFASIGRERGFLAGFRPDALWLEGEAAAGPSGPRQRGEQGGAGPSAGMPAQGLPAAAASTPSAASGEALTAGGWLAAAAVEPPHPPPDGPWPAAQAAPPQDGPPPGLRRLESLGDGHGDHRQPPGTPISGGSGGARPLGPAVVAVFPGRFTGEQHYVALLPAALLGGLSREPAARMA